MNPNCDFHKKVENKQTNINLTPIITTKVIKLLNLKREVGINIKSKETST